MRGSRDRMAARGVSLIAAVAVAASMSACGSAGEEESGLRTPPADAGQVTSIFLFDEGDLLSEGLVQVFPYGDEPVEIVDVRSNGTKGNLEYLGAYVAGPERPVNKQVVRSFPPEDPETGGVQPARGALVGPVPPELSEAGYQILLGYKVGEGRRGLRTSVSIDYRVGNGDVRTIEEAVGLVVCTDSATPCEDLDGEGVDISNQESNGSQAS